jgi:hypothetical protein
MESIWAVNVVSAVLRAHNIVPTSAVPKSAQRHAISIHARSRAGNFCPAQVLYRKQKKVSETWGRIIFQKILSLKLI